MKERAIYLEKVKKYYGSVPAVNNVTLEIFAAIQRAGASMVLTYHAKELARWLRQC